jgi:MFS family permease
MKENRRLLTIILFFVMLGSTMYGLFTPIYFLSEGLSYKRVVFYMISWCIGGILAGIFGKGIIDKFGVKSWIIGRGIFEPLTVLLLLVYPIFRYPPEIQGMLSGLFQMGFWISMDILTTKTTDKEHRGKQQSNIYLGMLIASLISPFLGGLIIAKIGYPWLFVTSFSLILGGGIISLFLKLETKKTDGGFFKIDKSMLPHFILSFLRGMTFSMTSWLFPLILFGIFKDELMLGNFGTVLSIIAISANTFGGLMIDKFSKKAIYSFFIASAMVWFLAGISIGNILLVMVGVITFFYNTLNLSINTLFFNSIHDGNATILVSQRLVSFCLGAMLLLIIHLFIGYEILFFLSGSVVAASLFFLRKV